MKSFNGLFDRMTEPEEIEAAIVEAAEGKRKRKLVQKTLEGKEEAAREIRERLLSLEWYPPKHSKRSLREGSHKKERQIEKPIWYDEQIVHHIVMRQFRPIVTPRMYEYSFGSIPGRGTFAAVKILERWRNGYRGKKFYVAELDIKKFYQNVDTEILKEQLRKLIRDKRYLEILFRIIDGAAPGLPLGFYTSPWFGNWYLTPFDRYIVHTLRPEHYLRYMDNLYIFHRNKKELHKIVAAVEQYLASVLRLRLNKSKQVYRFEYQDRRTGKIRGRAINALGFIVHRDRVTMRKTILKRARAKANRMHRKGKLKRIDAAAMISYMGYFSHTDTYGYYRRWIKPKVNIQYCKRYISRIARRSKKHDRMERGKGLPRGDSADHRHGDELDNGLRAPEYPQSHGDADRDGRGAGERKLLGV